MKKYIFKKNAEIGSLDAETDVFLNECFHKTELFESILKFDTQDPSFNKRIIVGRTGSGKTALLKQIGGSEGIISGEIKAEETILEYINNHIFISNLAKNGIDLRIFYKSLWIHVLLVKIILLSSPKRGEEGWISDIKEWVQRTSVKSRNKILANEYIDTYTGKFFNDEVIIEIADRMETHLKTGMTGIADGGITEEVRKNIQTRTSRYVSTELINKQRELIKYFSEELNPSQKRLVITIDDLDKSWLSQSDVRYDFINALLDAFKDLLDIKAVKILISIRSDILIGIYSKNLRQDEKDRSLISTLIWSEPEIKDILDKRIDYLIKNKYSGNQLVSFREIFNFNVKGQIAHQYISERVMRRPRDAIDFVNKCFSHADGQTELNEDWVLLGEEMFFESRKLALQKEWQSLYPDILHYVDSIHHLPTPNFFANEVNLKAVLEHLQNTCTQDEEIALEWKKILNVWFLIGLIGIVKSSTSIFYSNFEKSRLDLSDYDKKFFIHPLFWRKESE
jgi:hypothetical protein